jgi:hypothetical protein
MKSPDKQQEKVRKKKISEKSVSSLTDAIVGESFDVLPDSRFIIRISRSGKNVLCECAVKKVDENGIVHLWNETLEQWFAFSKKEAIDSKMFIKRL